MTWISAGDKGSKRRTLMYISYLIVAPLLLLGMVELILRSIGMRPIYDGSWEMLLDRMGDVQVLPSSSDEYTTNADGWWVASPETEGVNADGFRTGPLDRPKTQCPRVVFLGDSFTWGMSATPLSRSFVDLVRKAGYETFNFGIPGTGPSQYLPIAEKYVPGLDADAVCVMLFEGDDLDDRIPIVPGHPRFYHTTGPLLSGFDRLGRPWTVEEAIADYTYFFGTDTRAKVRRMMFRTATVSLILQGWYIMRGQYSEETKDVAEYLDGIERVTRESGAELFVFIIPPRESYSVPGRMDETLEKLEGLAPQPVKPMDDSFYAELPDAHYNNAGHRACAEQILEALKERGIEAGQAPCE